MKGEKITKKCEQCGKEYQTYFAHSIYCSKKCSQRAVNKRSYYKPGQIAKCNVCGKEFEKRKGFHSICSQECKKIALSHKKRREKIVYKECLFCGTQFTGKRDVCSDICEELQLRIDIEKEKNSKTNMENLTDFVKKIPKGMSYGMYVGLMESGKVGK